LLAEDEDTLRAVITEVLEEGGFQVTPVPNGEAALEAFQKETFPLVVTDIVMGGLNGLQLLETVKQLDATTQVVIMTSHATVEAAMKALRAGAYDFLIKPFEDLDMILVVARRAAEKVQLIRENRGLMESLRKQARELEQANFALKKLADSLKSVSERDGLTGLYNHKAFREALIRNLNQSKKKTTDEFALIFMDVDHFKAYNDNNGHLAGDELLKKLAELLQARFPEPAVVARYGGEEIVALVPATSVASARELAESIRQMVENFPFPGRENQPLRRISLSIGVSSYPHDGTDPTTLIDHADKAVYEAKSSGRNAVRWHSGMRSEV
jgi:diguanylate cyclase (GGDEF)-like protein